MWNFAWWYYTLSLTFITLSVTFDIISRSQQCQRVSTENLMFFIRLSWNFVDCQVHQACREFSTSFDLHTNSREITDVSRFDKKFIVGFFTDTVQARFFKLCIIMTLFKVYQIIPGLMTLTLFQGHRCVRIINCKLFSRFLSTIV